MDVYFRCLAMGKSWGECPTLKFCLKKRSPLPRVMSYEPPVFVGKALDLKSFFLELTGFAFLEE